MKLFLGLHWLGQEKGQRLHTKQRKAILHLGMWRKKPEHKYCDVPKYEFRFALCVIVFLSLHFPNALQWTEFVSCITWVNSFRRKKNQNNNMVLFFILLRDESEKAEWMCQVPASASLVSLSLETLSYFQITRSPKLELGVLRKREAKGAGEGGKERTKHLSMFCPSTWENNLQDV